MVKFALSESPLARCRIHRWILAFFWCLGLATGVLVALCMDESFLLLMRMAALRPVSIVSLFLTTFLPFITSAIAVYIAKPALLPVIAYLKAAVFSFISLMTFFSFGTAGWMIRCLVMFTDIVTLPFLYSFWHRHVGGSLRLSVFDGVSVVLVLLVCGMDAYWISPFIAELIHY